MDVNKLINALDNENNEKILNLTTKKNKGNEYENIDGIVSSER